MMATDVRDHVLTGKFRHHLAILLKPMTSELTFPSNFSLIVLHFELRDSSQE